MERRISPSRAKLVARELNGYGPDKGIGAGMCLIFNHNGTRSTYAPDNVDPTAFYDGNTIKIRVSSGHRWTADEVMDLWARGGQDQW